MTDITSENHNTKMDLLGPHGIQQTRLELLEKYGFQKNNICVSLHNLHRKEDEMKGICAQQGFVIVLHAFNNERIWSLVGVYLSQIF